MQFERAIIKKVSLKKMRCVVGDEEARERHTQPEKEIQRDTDRHILVS